MELVVDFARRAEKNQEKSSVRIEGFPAKIRIDIPPNTSPEIYCQINVYTNSY
jgi:hypothetical protein